MIGGLNEVEAIRGAERRRIPAGGYVVKMRVPSQMVSDNGKPYLEIEYDIAEGEWKGYYQEVFERTGLWLGNFKVYYNKKSLGFFKGFLKDVEESNDGIRLISDNGNVDERKLDGLLVGVVFREHEYMGSDGRVKSKMDKVAFLPADKIRAGEFKVPPKHEYVEKSVPESSGVVDLSTSFEEINEELPF